MKTDHESPTASSNFLRRYAIGLLAAAGSVAVRVALMPLLGTKPPYISFYLGTVVAAAYGGFGPGLLVTFAGIVFGFVVLPAGPVVIEQEVARLGLYVLSGVGICLVAEGMHRQRRRVQDQAQDLERVVRMLDLANVFVRDASDRITRWNSGCQRFYGYSAEEAVGRVSHELLRTRFPEPLGAIRAKLMAEGSWQGELLQSAADGRDVVVACNWVVHREGSGDEFSILEAVTDITGRKRAEEALRESEEHLRRAHDELELLVRERTEELRGKELLLEQQSRQAAMGEMVNNVAHQWRQPLNTLGLIIQSLPLMHDAGGLTAEDLEAKAEKAMEIITYMSQTIDDFRDYFKPDQERVPFHASRVVSRMITLTADNLKAHGMAVEVRAPVDPVILGYPNQFGQVLLNILLNARDALLERRVAAPKIVLTVGTEKGRAVITIADNAGGIPDEVMEKIFDPYFTTKGPEKGTGIGLFMSRTIIEKNMGGKLLVRNVGDGAEFRIEV